MNNQLGSPWRQPPPSQPPPRQRKSKKEFTIGCGVAIAVVLLFACIIAAVGSHSSINTSVTPTATAVLAQCIVTHIQLKEVDI